MAVTPIRYVVEVDTKNGLVKIDGLTKGFVDADIAAAKLNKTLLSTVKNTGQVINKTGLAGAAVVEIGRTISDANYGLTAMANNISQLSTLMVTLIVTSGGVKKGFAALIGAMRGPLGFIVLFQIGVALMEKFAIEAKKTGKATEELKDEIKDLNEEYNDYVELAKLDLELAESKTEEAKKLKKRVKELLVDKIREVELLEMQYEAEYNLLLLEIQRMSIIEGLNKAQQDWLVTWTAFLITASKKTAQEIIGPFGDPSVVGGISVDQSGAKATNAELERQERIKQSLLKLEIFRKKILKEIKDLDKDEGDESLDKLKKLKTTMLGLVGLDPQGKALGPGNKLLEALIGSDEDQLAKSAIEAWKGIADAFAAGSEDESVKQYWYAQTEARKDFYLGMIMPFYNQSVDLLLSRYDREAVIEQNATNQKNNALRDRLRNENLSAEERKRIQLKISDNDEELRKRQDKIAEKRFNAEKAANIVTAIVETYVAANKALAQFGGAPFGIGPMAATIALGLANVATIASQKFQTSASTAPTAGDLGVTQGSNASSITPNFNIVGDTGINQLRDTIMGVVDRPVKTYITGKDVRTSEELERNIIRGSTLGG